MTAWRVSDLVCDPATGRLKETLLWSNLGKLSALIWFSWKCYNDTDTTEMWWVVMVVLTAHAAFSQLVMSKFGPPVPAEGVVKTVETKEVTTSATPVLPPRPARKTDDAKTDTIVVPQQNLKVSKKKRGK